ncbi:MAG: tRNA (N(6)-L-threonylcarbamoyladenosine(37)-C(2))-methylthiotransferase [Candidatus Micrarchaeota archaeon]|nr:tRNA (N(6)-L-threonylcarbamoyladenosine(37)-C(2))-methylthiotransferase [Candidatus Micrarchaeota archaeon]
MKTYIKTYGCTLNRADSEMMGSMLVDSGAELCSSASEADVVVVNTCTVKSATAQKILYNLDSLSSQGKRLVVAGCMAGANRDMISKHAPSASIVTPQNIHAIGDAVRAAYHGGKASFVSDSREDKIAHFSPSPGVISRIPISDGCVSACGFCETKRARGRLNSFTEDLIVKAVERSVAGGAREIELTAQDVGAYGLDRGTNIAELMSRISGLDGGFKVRVGMLNPEHLHRYFDDFAEQMNSGKFYKFAHLPLQSGSDSVLADMGRDYTVGEYNGYVGELRKRVSGITIATDIIVGYPSETEEDFSRTLDFIKEIKPDVTNLSKFGARPHTRAARMGQHPRSVINERSRKAARVVRSVQHEINDGYMGMEIPVLITESSERSINGRSDSYKQVVIRERRSAAPGSTVLARIESASANVLYGSMA